jgi:hypothetical protein
VRRFSKRLIRLGALAGIGYAIWRFFERRRGEPGVSWEQQPFPYPPSPRPTEPAGGDAAPPAPPAPTTPPPTPGASPPKPAAPEASVNGWAEPADGTCPISHPVKAKLSSGIFHVPGGANYRRTNPDRCYRDAPAAEADGLRQSAR